jgi:integrase
MTLSTGKRKVHFKCTRPTDPNIKPFGEWLPENRRFHADFCSWLKQGGYSMSAIHLYSVGTRLALGFLDKPSVKIEIERDLQRARAYLAVRSLSSSTCAAYEKGLNKLAQYLRLRQNIPSPEKTVDWDRYFMDVPEWIVKFTRAYVEYRSRSWNHDNSIQLTHNLLSQLCGFARLTQPASLSDITPKRWFAYVSERAKIGIKPTTLNTILWNLQAFLRFLQDANQPICERMLAVRPQKSGSPLPRDLPVSDVKALLQATTKPTDRAWLLLMLHSGLRTCEIRRMKWEAVDLERCSIRIEQSKGQKDRLVFLSQPAVEALQALPLISEFVFTRHLNPLSRRYCQSRLATIGRNCAIKVTPHQLRHTAATLLLNAGMSVWGVKEILGHESVQTTMRYVRVYDSKAAKEYQAGAGSPKDEHNFTGIVKPGAGS